MTFGVDMKRGRRIMILAAPIVIAMFTQTAINIVDTIFVGKLDPNYSIPGQSALGFSLPILWAIGGFLAAIGVGTQAMVARRFGSGNPLDAGKVLTNSLIVAFFTSIVATAIGWYGVPYFFRFLTHNESVIALGVPYARLRILGVMAMVMTTSFKGFFDGIGMTRVHMYAALVMNAFNIMLNPIFIFGFGPIEAQFVTGAAIASLISTYIGLSMMAIWSMRGKYNHPHRYYRIKNIKPKIMWEISKLSAPSGAAQLFVMSGVLLFLKIVGMLDESAASETIAVVPLYAQAPSFVEFQNTFLQSPQLGGLAFAQEQMHAVSWSKPPIYTAAAKLIIDLLLISFVTCIAFGTATATLVSQSMGERKFDLAESYGWDSVKLGAYFFGTIGIVVILFPELFLDVLSDDETVIEAAVPGLRIMAALEIWIAMALILTQALFGAGATKFVMWTELVLHGFCLAPLAWIFAIHLELGFNGVWLSAAIYTVVLAVAMAVKFWSGSWKSIEV